MIATIIGKQPSKEDKFEYVTHGKLYKIDKEGSGADFKLYAQKLLSLSPFRSHKNASSFLIYHWIASLIQDRLVI
ncbi:hypothetical protein SADUNF_Sadunf13G0058700 [Salix dunnii]|uniref:Uncharacterized protein n=1 Tax=Salix dunnii TaxID=1413687 RepID=A0A835JNP9_9ROSI|nr:hypothetical protein SADUNF_Sadunf13G0058700 [Salix dunnii]